MSHCVVRTSHVASKSYLCISCFPVKQITGDRTENDWLPVADCVFMIAAGALGGYMWKHRGVNQSTDKLLSIAGIAALSLAMGWSNETKVDNLGQRGTLHPLLGCNIRV